MTTSTSEVSIPGQHAAVGPAPRIIVTTPKLRRRKACLDRLIAENMQGNWSARPEDFNHVRFPKHKKFSEDDKLTYAITTLLNKLTKMPVDGDTDSSIVNTCFARLDYTFSVMRLRFTVSCKNFGIDMESEQAEEAKRYIVRELTEDFEKFMTGYGLTMVFNHVHLCFETGVSCSVSPEVAEEVLEKRAADAARDLVETEEREKTDLTVKKKAKAEKKARKKASKRTSNATSSHSLKPIDEQAAADDAFVDLGELHESLPSPRPPEPEATAPGKQKATPDVAESSMGGDSTCTVCFTHEKTHLAAPCGHLCACYTCSKKMAKCPHCRADVAMWVKVHEV